MKKILGVSKSVIFLLAVFVLYLVVYFIDREYTKTAFSGFIRAFLNIIPILVIVFFIMFFVNYFLRPEKVKKHLGHESGLKGWIYTLFIGSFIPMGPPYVVLPLLGDLKKQGMRESLIVAFLYIRNLQIIFLIVMAYYFGILFTGVVAFYVFLFSILSGVLVERLYLKG